MYLNIINPLGHAYSADMTMPLWRLELARWGPDPTKLSVQPTLGLIMRYVVGVATVDGMGRTITQTVQVCGIDTTTNGDELIDLVAKGLPHADRKENRDYMKERLGILHNAITKAADADDLVARALQLVDIRHDILEALWGQRPEALAALGPRLKGTYEGYQYAVVANRFDAWLSTGDVMEDAPAPMMGGPGKKKR